MSQKTIYLSHDTNAISRRRKHSNDILFALFVAVEINKKNVSRRLKNLIIILVSFCYYYYHEIKTERESERERCKIKNNNNNN